METDSKEKKALEAELISSIKKELNFLDKEMIDINGNQLKPSQCYRFELNPPHILFNTNCPDQIREKVESILSRYIPPNESRSSQ